MDPTINPITVSTTEPSITPWGIDIFSLFFSLFGSSEASASFFSAHGFLSFLNTLWSVYAVLAFIASIIMLGLYTYASIGRWHFFQLSDQEIHDGEKAYDELYRGVHKKGRLSDILNHIQSENPNDWKLAIIEADIILDDILKQRGYVGNSLGERLRNISSQQLGSIQDAWEAHKVRNRIAHDGADFVLTKHLADETIARYRRVFSEFGVS
jgi:hypothetical protein